MVRPAAVAAVPFSPVTLVNARRARHELLGEGALRGDRSSERDQKVVCKPLRPAGFRWTDDKPIFLWCVYGSPGRHDPSLAVGT